MSTEVTTAFVKQFSANVFHLSQQKESRLKSLVRNETQNGKSAFYDRIGLVTAQKKTTRHGDTPQTDTPHSRRRVTLVDYEHADLVDEVDKLRLLMDPASHYSIAFGRALGRAIDDEIIAAFGGNSFGGEEGSTTIDWEDITSNSTTRDQRLFAVNSGATDDVNMNVEALRRAKKILDENEVGDDQMRNLSQSASQFDSLLQETEVISSDFAVVKALALGQINTYLGFSFTRSQRHKRLTADLTTANATTGAVYGASVTITATTSRRCFAWAEDGMLLATASNMKIRIAERPDKSFSTQVFAAMSLGATRLEDEKVVEIICNES